LLEDYYKEVMRGNPETELKMLALAVGGPFMTQNEARATQNLPPLDGGDELLPPPNQSIPADAPADVTPAPTGG
jgi:hypothetical protein